MWLLFRILFNCTIWSDTIQFHSSQSQVLRPFLKVPDVELRLITKALFTCGSLTERDCLLLEDVEILRLKQMLNTDLVVPFSFHGLSFEVLFKMMRQLANVPQNALLFIANDIQSIIADLSERLLGDEQEMAMELLWFLMQIDGDALSRDTMNNRDSTEPGPIAEQSYQQKIGIHLNILYFPKIKFFVNKVPFTCLAQVFYPISKSHLLFCIESISTLT